MKRNFVIFAVLVCLTLPVGAQIIDRPVATVKLIKQEVISAKQFKSDIDKLETVSNKKLTIEEKKQYLDLMVNDVLFLQMCDRDKLNVTDNEIQTQIQTMKSPSMSDAQFLQTLQAQGVQASDLRSYVKKQLLLQKYITTKRTADIQGLKDPTEDEIMKSYELSRTQLVRPDSARIAMIFVDCRGKNDQEKEKARDLIDKLYAQVKGNPQKFEELTYRSNDRDSGYKGTDQIYMGKTLEQQNAYGTKLFEAVFKLKTGDISEVIETSTGYNIVKLLETYPQKILALSDSIQFGNNLTVHDYIKNTLAQQKQQALLQSILTSLVEELRSQATIKIFEEAIS
jgi:parvulin-like peptidyl-prolyl isomerase